MRHPCDARRSRKNFREGRSVASETATSLHSARLAREAIPHVKRPGELTVAEVASKFNVGSGVVYYWIKHGMLLARRRNQDSPLWVTLDLKTERKLRQRADRSLRIQKSRSNHSQRLL